MDSNKKSISDLENIIAEKICLKIENWNLYLGDAGLARILAIECLANLEKFKRNTAKESLKLINVRIGDGTQNISLIKFVTPSQIIELEDILDDFSF